MNSKNKSSLAPEGIGIAFALLFITIKFLYRNTENVKEFFYKELPAPLLTAIGIGLLAYALVRFLLSLDIENKERWDKEAVEEEQREKKAREEQESRIDENLRSELHNLATLSENLLKGENTNERKKALQNVLNLSKRERYNREGIINDKIVILAPFKKAIREIDIALDIENKRREEDEDKILESENYKRGYYKKQELSKENIHLLIGEGFQERQCRGFEGKANLPYLLKPRENESVEHFFLVRYVQEYLEQKGFTVETPNSRE